MTDEEEVRRLIGMLQRAKRAIGPVGGVVHKMKGLTDSQRRSYLKQLDGAYQALKTVQDDISR